MFLIQGTEITSVIQQWKEMNCEAESINVMDQGRERGTNATKAFWNALGGKAPIQGRLFTPSSLKDGRKVLDAKMHLTENIGPH